MGMLKLNYRIVYSAGCMTIKIKSFSNKLLPPDIVLGQGIDIVVID